MPENQTDLAPRVTLDEATDVLMELAEAMHGVQMPSNVVQGYLRGVAERLGVVAEVALLQSYVAADVRHSGRHRVVLRRIDFDADWRLARLHDLAELATSVADGSCNVTEARAQLRQLASAPVHYPHTLVVVGYSLYGASVAARVGGGLLEMFAASILGVAAGLIHFGGTRSRLIDLQKSFFAGIVGSGIVLVLSKFIPQLDIARALFAGVTLLVPAMVIAIGTHELANGALESGSARLAYGLLRFVMLGAGIAAAIKLWSLAAPLPATTVAAGLPIPAVLGILVAGGAALVFCLQARISDGPAIVIAVLAAYGSQAVAKVAFGEDAAPFLSAFTVGALGNLYGVFFRGTVPATVVVPGLLQLAPGFLGTEAVFALLANEQGGHETFFRVLLIAVQLESGLLLASVLFTRARPSPSTSGGVTRAGRTIRARG